MLSVGAFVMFSGIVALLWGPRLAAAEGASPRTYYVAVGASESIGYQPTPAAPRGAPTREGYANDLVTMERPRWAGLHLVQYGCAGITAEGALDGHERCHYPAGSEIATAVRFVDAHRARTVLITVDLGFNDIWPCLIHHTVDGLCVNSALDVVGRVLPRIVTELHRAARPGALIVGLQHPDPYLGDYLRGGGNRAFARSSISVFHRFNAELATVYSDNGALVADVPAAYRTADVAPAYLAGHGSVPTSVAQVCTLTWMCTLHNVHPNAAGYQTIAAAIAEAIQTAPITPT